MGDIIRDRYRINKVLNGRYPSITYLATDLKTANPNNLECVIKKIKLSESLSLAENQDYLDREIKALKVLGKHPQIPSFIDFFIEGESLYIVRELIAGTLLSEKIKPGNKLLEKEVKELLLELLKIVSVLHQNKYIHRDLKPSNIIQRNNGSLAIVDFGAFTEINNLEKNGSGNILSKLSDASPYVAPERLSFPRPQELDCHPRIDIYSLGIIGLQAITGLAPDSLHIKSHDDDTRVWNNGVVTSPKMKHLLNKMAHPNYNLGYRYQNIDEVLTDLNSISSDIPYKLLQKVKNFNRQAIRHSLHNIPLKLAILCLFLSLYVGLYLEPGAQKERSVQAEKKGDKIRVLPYLNNKRALNKLTKVSNDSFSMGEEILDLSTQDNSLKIQGVKLYQARQYEAAAKAFREYWNAGNKDAEALVYLNNALIELSSARSYTIAVVVPFHSEATNINNKPKDVGKEILRGVAKAQEEANLGLFNVNLESIADQQLPNIETLKQRILQGQRLKVIIAVDSNQAQEAIEIAEKLSEVPFLLGTIGHYSSNITSKTIDIYRNNQIILMSPTSSAESLADSNNNNSFFFRTIPNVKNHAEALADYLIYERGITEAAVFYSSDITSFSYSYWQEFKTIFEDEKGKIVLKYDNLNSTDFDPQKAIANINQAQNINSTKGSSNRQIAIVLLSDEQPTETYYNAQQIVKFNDNQHWIVATENLYSPETIQNQDAKLLEKFAIAVPWHHSNSSNSYFVRENQQVWQKKVSYRTALSYDAAKVLIEALTRVNTSNPKSSDLQTIISQTDFIIRGATGNIKFSDRGNREGQSVQLVKVISCNHPVFVAVNNAKCYEE